MVGMAEVGAFLSVPNSPTSKVMSRSRSRSLRREPVCEKAGQNGVPVTKLRASLNMVVEASERSESVPLPTCLSDVYGESGHESACRAAQALVRACDEFVEAYGEQNVQVVRSPARINLRGMHIDNNGGYTNSILLDREVFIVFSPTSPGNLEPGIRLRNTDEQFTPKAVMLPSKVTEDDIKQSPGWTKYCAAAILALEQIAGVDTKSASLSGVVASTTPAGVGLSSSHAFVICMLNALIRVSNAVDRVDPTTELRTAQRAEHLTGIKSGLMDQGSMIFGQAASLLHGRFYDLKVNEIANTIKHCPWPRDCSVVVANSKVVRQLAKGATAAKYGLPRLGCAIAMPVLRREAAKRGLEPDNESSWGVETTLELLKSVPAEAPLSELLVTFSEHAADIEAAVQRFIPGGRQSLGDMPIPLRGSTLFTLAESARGKDFFSALKCGDIATCGKLMDVGHEGDAPDGNLVISDADLEDLAKRHVHDQRAEGQNQISLSFIPGSFCAGHARLDELCKALRGLGAEGASLTGAGHGGCVVALFDSRPKANDAVEGLLRDFPDLSRTDVFVAVPIQGRGLLDLKNM